MAIRRVALIFDNTLRPDTTGVHCQRALGELVHVEHFLPTDLQRIPRDGFDLYLNIDDGLRYRLPDDLHPCVWWAIDTHLDFDWYRTKGPDFDFVFVAQRDGAERLREEGLPFVQWLPLACNPEIHKKHEIDRRFDICFVGTMIPGPRTELVELLRRRFQKMFVGQRYGEEMARVYSASCTIFNRSVGNDINMRVFEALACGSLLVTNDLAENGQEELFRDGEHLAVYRDPQHLLDRVAWYLDHEEARETIAANGRTAVLQKHTYRHRMEKVLRDVERELGSRVVNSAAGAPAASHDDSYYEFARPEVLSLIPTSARQVLDVGCGAGMLGASLKARQGATVCGIEWNHEAAQAAKSRLDEVLIGDAEQMDGAFPDGRFECIVCADVLEHMRAPDRFLRQARAWLAPEGQLVASIPNVGHHTVVGSLLQGNWTYESAGLLDRDHLRFFTRREIEALFRRTGLRVTSLRAVPGPGYQQWAEQGQPGRVDVAGLRVEGLTPEEAEGFFVYQWLLAATPWKDPESRQAAEGAFSVQAEGTLGCVLAIQNRSVDVLVRTLQTYEYQTLQPSDRVLLDYGSAAGLSEDYRRACKDYGWRYVRIAPDPPEWHLTAAYNRAVLALDRKAAVVFKSDADVLLGAGVLETALKLGRRRLCVFPCLSAVEGTEYPDRVTSEEDLLGMLKRHPRAVTIDGEGIHAFPREWFEKLGGYDLGLEHWGFEDSDLRFRAEQSIGVARPRETLLIHQWHPQTQRPEETCKNRTRYEQMKGADTLVRNGGRLVRDQSELRSAVEASVDFAVTTFLRPRALLRLLRSIRRSYPRVLVTIADDGDLRKATDRASRSCCRLIDADPRIVLHTLPFDSGPSEARNLLIARTRAPYILLLDDDCCFTEQTRVETLLRVLQRDETIGVVGGGCIHVSEGRRTPGRFAGTLEIRDGELIHTPGAWHDPKRKLRDIVCPFAMFRRNVFRDVRWEGDPGGYYYDFFVQLKQANWNVCQEDSVLIDHFHRSPALPGHPERRDAVASGQKALMKKWGLRRITIAGTTLCEDDEPLADRSVKPESPGGPLTLPQLNPHDSLFNDWSISRRCWEVVRELLRPGMLTLECGSGLSTLLFQAAGCRHTALEHDPRRMAPSDAVVLAPLSGHPLWYDWQPPHPFDLIFVNGPPGTTGRHGILRVLGHCMHENTVLVLDGTHQRAEKELADMIADRYGLELEQFRDGRRSFTVCRRRGRPPLNAAAQTDSFPADTS